MSWHRGEVWFDFDVLWFREGSGAPAPAYSSPYATAPAIAPGLVASRQRRAALRQRRSARKVRAAAFVLSPAAIIPFSAIRGGDGSGNGIITDDPPSLTIRLARISEGSVSHEIARARDHAAASAASAAEAAPVYQPVVWHTATSSGLPYSGSLTDGTQLPVEGDNWVTWNPVTDSVPNEPYRLYGNEHTIRTIISVIDAYSAANPDAPRVVVGDISFEHGGRMDEHVSHQNGLDVDIYYPRLDRGLRDPVSTDAIDRTLAQELLDRFIAAGAQVVFVGYSTGLTGPSGVVVPYPHHENHMHVRFPSPG